MSVLLNTTAPGATTPSFATQQTFATGTNSRSVGWGDVNGDGLLDLAVANQGSANVSVLLNTTAPGATAPSFAAQQTFATGNSPRSVALGDVNGDGLLDLVVANTGSNDVSVLLNTTAPGATTLSFTTQQTFATGSSPISVAFGDVNGDGLLDLAVANLSSDNVSVLLNTTTPGATTPTFAPRQNFATGDGPLSVALGDVNGDGLLDLVVANTGSNTVSVLLNTTAPGATTPTFATQQTFATGSAPRAVAFGDVNGDGLLDLAVANQNSNTVSVLLNTTVPGATTPTFAPQQSFTAGTDANFVALGDVNGDGLLDLAVANYGSNTVSVLLNTGVKVTLSDASATGTIADDDVPPSISVNSPSVTEGNTGAQTLTFTISLDAISGQTVSGQAVTANGSATAGSDYVAIASTPFTIAAGSLSTTVDVTVNGDTTDEPNETFTLNLSGVTNTSNATASGTGTIVNDDVPPAISVDSPPSVTEGNTGTQTLTFTISLDAISGQAVTGNFATANGSASAGSDYVAIASTPFTIAAGSLSTTVAVTVNGDTTDEPNETFTLNLSGVTNTSNATASGTGTITDDDVPPVSPPTVDLSPVSTTPGTSALVNVLNADGSLRFAIQPFDAYLGGTTTSAGDVNADGVPDILIGAGPGAMGGHVKVFDGVTGVEIRSFLAFDGFAGGVTVEAGDVNRDGVDDIIVGAGPGAPGGHVKVFDGVTGAEIRSFFAFDAGFIGGVTVDAGDVTGDGVDDILVGSAPRRGRREDFPDVYFEEPLFRAGPGAPGGHVKVFDGVTGVEIRSFFPFDGFAGGVTVRSGDVNADGVDDILVGAGLGAAGGHVKVFDGVTGEELRSFFVFDGFTGGVTVGAGDVNGDGFVDILVGAGPGAGPHVKVFDGASGEETLSFLAFDAGFLGGVTVEAGDVNADGIDDILVSTTTGPSHVKGFSGLDGSLLLSELASDLTLGVFVG